MLGFPTETWDEIRQSVRMAEEIDVDYVKLFAVIPLRHTKLRQLCEDTGSLKESINETDEIWSTGQMIETDQFSANDITILRAYEWDRINFQDRKKRRRTAEMMHITEQELDVVRKKTFKNAQKAIMGY